MCRGQRTGSLEDGSFPQIGYDAFNPVNHRRFAVNDGHTGHRFHPAPRAPIRSDGKDTGLSKIHQTPGFIGQKKTQLFDRLRLSDLTFCMKKGDENF